MAKKIIGISIDGVIRNMHAGFDKSYRKAFIKNDSLVQMNEKFEFVPDSPVEDEIDSLQRMVDEKIHLPVDTFDLMNHYHFESKEECDKFFDDYSFEILGSAPFFHRAMDSINRIQALAESSGVFDVVLLSTEKSQSRISTYHFLAKAGCRVGALRFVDEHTMKWDYCDIIVDDCPYVFESKPAGKVSIKISRPYNAYSEADHSFESASEISADFIVKILKPQ
jgi:hypothetical protein